MDEFDLHSQYFRRLSLMTREKRQVLIDACQELMGEHAC